MSTVPDFSKMSIPELIKYGHITMPEEGKLRLAVHHAEMSAFAEVVRPLKPQIIAHIQAEQAAKEQARLEYQAKLDGIEGLAELEDAIEAWRQYHADFNRRMDDENLSSILLPRPEADPKALRAKYPRAAAYLKAQAYSFASNYAKASAGGRALKRILNGENYAQALDDMEAEWSAHCRENIWD